MDKTKIIGSLATLSATAALLVGASFAYFSDTEISNGNTLTAGTLTVEITDQNLDTPFASEAIISNWAPGQTTLVNFDIKNTGTLPVNLRAFATGSWSGVGDPALVKVTEAEYWDGSGWVTFAGQTSGGLTGYIYYSPNGTDSSPFSVAGGGSRAQIRLTVEFDSGAGNTYQGQTFTASLNAEA